MNPADVQQRADAEVGAAWRRARAAVGPGGLVFGRDDLGYSVLAEPRSPNRITSVELTGSDEVDALDALVRVLEAGKDCGE